MWKKRDIWGFFLAVVMQSLLKSLEILWNMLLMQLIMLLYYIEKYSINGIINDPVSFESIPIIKQSL